MEKNQFMQAGVMKLSDTCKCKNCTAKTVLKEDEKLKSAIEQSGPSNHQPSFVLPEDTKLLDLLRSLIIKDKSDQIAVAISQPPPDHSKPPPPVKIDAGINILENKKGEEFKINTDDLLENQSYSIAIDKRGGQYKIRGGEHEYTLIVTNNGFGLLSTSECECSESEIVKYTNNIPLTRRHYWIRVGGNYPSSSSSDSD